jgi:membrane-bound ClpP family serine protease
MDRLLNVALSGVLTLIGLAVTAAGLAVLVGTREPGTESRWYTIGLVALVAGACVFLGAGVRTLYLVIQWRRQRGERSARP